LAESTMKIQTLRGVRGELRRRWKQFWGRRRHETA